MGSLLGEVGQRARRYLLREPSRDSRLRSVVITAGIIASFLLALWALTDRGDWTVALLPVLMILVATAELLPSGSAMAAAVLRAAAIVVFAVFVTLGVAQLLS